MPGYETTAKFPVVMLYDHFNSVGRAMATYSHLTHELENDYQPDLRVWRIDDATSGAFSTEANDDIAAAEVIIMTIRGDAPFPAAFQHWMDDTGPGAVGAPHGIIALIRSDEGPDPAADSWNRGLRGAATQIHPEVFVCEEQ